MDAIDKTGTPRSAHDLLMDIQWNCENCTARLQHEDPMVVEKDHGRPVTAGPCEHCRLRKYGYGGQV